MIARSLDTSGLFNIDARLKRLANLDFEPLMVEWETIIYEDNRKGVLAGIDGYGVPMIPVTYRPRNPRSLTVRQRNNAHGAFAGFGPFAAGLHNNLTTAEYIHLTGPPLAPRFANSRVITNFDTASGPDGDHKWVAFGHWVDVVTPEGIELLPIHFNGIGVAVRDLAHIRPDGVRRARAALRTWTREQLRRP